MFLERKTPQDTYFESAWSFLSQKSYLWHPVFQNHSIFNLFELLCSLIEVGNLQLLLGLTSTNSSYWTGLLGSLCGILMDLSYNEYLFLRYRRSRRFVLGICWGKVFTVSDFIYLLLQLALYSFNLQAGC